MIARAAMFCALLLAWPTMAGAKDPMRVDVARDRRLTDSTYAGVSFFMREYVGDRAYRIIPNTEGETDVDYRSTAALAFGVVDDTTSLDRWNRINLLLPRVRELSGERTRLNELVNVPAESVKVAVNRFNQKLCDG